jgi:hypothetical protein
LENQIKLVKNWDELEECKRGDKQIGYFISDFDRAYRKVEGDGGKIHPTQ